MVPVLQHPPPPSRRRRRLARGGSSPSYTGPAPGSPLTVPCRSASSGLSAESSGVARSSSSRKNCAIEAASAPGDWTTGGVAVASARWRSLSAFQFAVTRAARSWALPAKDGIPVVSLLKDHGSGEMRVASGTPEMPRIVAGDTSRLGIGDRAWTMVGSL